MNQRLCTAHNHLDAIKQKKSSVFDIINAYSSQIKLLEEDVHAFARQIPREGKNELENKNKSASRLPLPIAVKDNLCLKNHETTCCSKILSQFKPSYDATVIEKLKSQNCIITAQANMDEFAFGSSTETSCYGPTHNPWNLNHVPGGSSGGSAAAVAAGEVVWALGSDTGGSIRQPAAFCGVVGVKPTYGRVSRYGLIAFASSLDQIGPLTQDVHDAALLLSVIAGYDERDSTSVKVDVDDYVAALTNDVKGLKIGIPNEYLIEGVAPQVKQSITEAIEILRKKGAVFKEISLPHTEYCVATYYIIATAEASSNLARYDGVRYGLRCFPQTHRKNSIIDMFEETRNVGFGQESKRRIMLGTYCLSSGYYDAYYLRAQKVRTLIKNDFDNVFTEVDAILTPTTPTPAFQLGEKTQDPISMYLSDIFTISANLSGLPAISVPCGISKAGLPIGLQVITKPFNESMMFRIAHCFEQATQWHKQKPFLKK